MILSSSSLSSMSLISRQSFCMPRLTKGTKGNTHCRAQISTNDKWNICSSIVSRLRCVRDQNIHLIHWQCTFAPLEGHSICVWCAALCCASVKFSITHFFFRFVWSHTLIRLRHFFARVQQTTSEWKYKSLEHLHISHMWHISVTLEKECQPPHP